MKSILYVGATLMIGASIYGFVDYRQSSQKKEFTTMYDEEKKVPVVTEEVITEPEDKNLIAKKQAVNKEEISNVTEKKEVKASVTATKKSKAVVKKAKKKKLDHRIFSRAPLRDEEINMAELVKPEEKKLEKKEQ